ncbi:Hypothetical predicted protein [Pelobates cultripes]|uniref:Uncharacterized protein n=1 Tax=Pelobates cultripes TaxID=61616 RepID=A0AAD1WUB0_PELCU|nr:Hypothetical predicted protein [Pelobates cultripes]
MADRIVQEDVLQHGASIQREGDMSWERDERMAAANEKWWDRVGEGAEKGEKQLTFLKGF